MEEKSDTKPDKAISYGTLCKQKLEECRKFLKGYPDLIARSFEAAESANKDHGPNKKMNTVVGKGEITKEDGHLRVLQYNILADGKMNEVLVPKPHFVSATKLTGCELTSEQS